jgi:hypothetical protein
VRAQGAAIEPRVEGHQLLGGRLERPAALAGQRVQGAGYPVVVEGRLLGGAQLQRPGLDRVRPLGDTVQGAGREQDAVQQSGERLRVIASLDSRAVPSQERALLMALMRTRGLRYE